MSAASQFFGGSGGGGIGSPVPDTMKVIEVLLVGGGGGGGGYGPSGYGGGGGAGAMLEATNFLVMNGSTYPITIGGGGSAPPTAAGAVGSPSTFGSLISGGGGGGGAADGAQIAGQTTFGGSPGGAGGPNPFNSSTIPPSNSFVYTETFNVFDKITTIYSFICTATSRAGTNDRTPGGGASTSSGLGRSNSITGSPVTYASGGAAGGGNTAATSNTGNGGSGHSPATANGGSGGSGVCIIRWPTAYPDASSVSGNTPTPAQPGYYVYRWNGDGSITF